MSQSHGGKYKSEDGGVDKDAPDMDEDYAAEAERFRSPRNSQVGKPDEKLRANSGAVTPKETRPPVEFGVLQTVGAKAKPAEPKKVSAFTGAGGLDNAVPISQSPSPRAESKSENMQDRKPEISSHLAADPDYKPKKKSIWSCLSCCFSSAKSTKIHPEQAAQSDNKKKPHK